MREVALELPPTDYGDWISPDGEAHAVEPSRKHVGFAPALTPHPRSGT